jgi:hypothetical protein
MSITALIAQQDIFFNQTEHAYSIVQVPFVDNAHSLTTVLCVMPLLYSMVVLLPSPYSLEIVQPAPTPIAQPAHPIISVKPATAVSSAFRQHQVNVSSVLLTVSTAVMQILA